MTAPIMAASYGLYRSNGNSQTWNQDAHTSEDPDLVIVKCNPPVDGRMTYQVQLVLGKKESGYDGNETANFLATLQVRSVEGQDDAVVAARLATFLAMMNTTPWINALTGTGVFPTEYVA